MYLMHKSKLIFVNGTECTTLKSESGLHNALFKIIICYTVVYIIIVSLDVYFIILLLLHIFLVFEYIYIALVWLTQDESIQMCLTT